MLIGVTPFYNRNRNMLLMKIKNSKVIFPDKTKYKIEYSAEIEDLITRVSIIIWLIFNSYLSRTRRKDLGIKEMGRKF